MHDHQKAKSIRVLLSDVDGIMTDGRLLFDRTGEELKSFHVRDGLGIQLWRQAGFRTAWISGRDGLVVRQRAEALGVDAVRLGVHDKLSVAKQLIDQWGVSLQEVCYIGDDLPDLPLLQEVFLPVTVADAPIEIRQACHWVLQQKGGQGAIRELVERLLRAKGCWSSLVSAYLPERTP
jgi:3-deoxy-D-manno-octulosonate 8-phosphate phosphatase (KDO 8-P phosphatase)